MNPALGGLSAYLFSITPAVAALGHSSEIVCLDDPGESFLSTVPVPVHALGPARLGYAYAPGLRPWLQAEVARFDAVVVHGLWQYHGLAMQQVFAHRATPPYFVFSHGMLDPWFKRQYPFKHLKKSLYWWLAERRVLRGAAAVLFTGEEERRLARESFAGSSYAERVVTFGTAAPPDDATGQLAAFFHRMPELRDTPYWLFLGRIHPKKGADLLIEAYARLTAGGGAWPRLVMAGPCADAAYLAQLQAHAAAHCPAGAVRWPGMLRDETKWGALRAAEAFVLPSHQENFGIAVAEALACGTPVLISDQVNIWREVTGDGAGLAGPDTADGTFDLLNQWSALDAGTRRQMRATARRTFLSRYEIGAGARSLMNVLQGPQPCRRTLVLA